MMRSVWTAFVLWVLTQGVAFADPVEVTFRLPPDHAEQAVSWSATPLDLPEDADVLAAMTMEPEPFAGPWTVFLEPGRYLVSAFSEVDVFELDVAISAGLAEIEVPLLNLATEIPFRCPDVALCQFKDDATGLLFDLPQGWAADRPLHADLGDGTFAKDVSATFFEDVEGDGADVWFLNPVDWVEEDETPCQDTSLGPMCTFDLSDKAKAAFDVIAPSLRISESTQTTTGE